MKAKSWLALGVAMTFCSGFLLTVFLNTQVAQEPHHTYKVLSPKVLEKLAHNKNFNFHIPIQSLEASLIPEDVAAMTHVDEERTELEVSKRLVAVEPCMCLRLPVYLTLFRRINGTEICAPKAETSEAKMGR